ncbi:MAG TPA: hypothetical protein VH083_07585 [Myxococcales bacterium]|nr:hypothetical protein [Myxococcales bacterium]
MNFAWHVVVRDDKGAPITDAKVALVTEATVSGSDFPFVMLAATHSHKAAGAYEPTAAIAPSAGKWLLIVTRKDKSPAMQPITLKAAGSDFGVSTAGGVVAAVETKSALAGSGAAATRNTSFVVTLFPSAELVFLTGTDYSGGGVDFRLFAVDHARALLKDSKIDKGTRVTIFCSDARARQSLAFTNGGDLMLVSAHSFGSAAGIKPGAKHAPDKSADFMPIDFYGYLDDIGNTDPHRVREVGVFSHSWPGGPILFNTSDTFGPTGLRDPDDFDLREKDFNTDNLPAWSKLKDAMAPGGSWQIWGCSATTMFKDWMREALKVSNANQLFPVTSDTKHHDGSMSQHVEARLTRALVRKQMDLRFRSGSYMAAAATALAIPVFGAPPGVGADYSKPGGLWMMGMTGNTAPYAFFQQDFMPGFVPTNDKHNKGYVDYRVMQGRAAMPDAPFDPGAYVMTVDFDLKKTGLAFMGGKHPPSLHDGTSVKLTATAKKDFPAAGRSGWLYVLEDTDKTKSEGFYLQTDGKLFLVGRDAKTQAFTDVAPAPL